MENFSNKLILKVFQKRNFILIFFKTKNFFLLFEVHFFFITLRHFPH